jgi:Cys-rich four helix bundle protein (predicted Tat secretion target)
MEDMHAPRYKGVEDTASHCAASGEDCLRHSLGMWAMKDVTMAACANSVMQLVAACRALATLAALNSQFTVAFAKDVALVCDDAEKECRKFASVSPECRECAESCKKCSDECRKLVAGTH